MILSSTTAEEKARPRFFSSQTKSFDKSQFLADLQLNHHRPDTPLMMIQCNFTILAKNTVLAFSPQPNPVGKHTNLKTWLAEVEGGTNKRSST